MTSLLLDRPAARTLRGPGVSARLPTWRLPAIAAILALTALLPPGPRTAAALAAIILLGIPHGALDIELARSALRPLLPRTWFPAFAVPYLALSAGVLVAWSLAPLPVLAIFLAASVWHFGTEETGSSDPLPVIGAGGMPIALASLFHPAATAAIFGTVAQVPTMTALPSWLLVGSILWLIPATVLVATMVRRGNHRHQATTLAMAAAAIVLPPLVSFTIYFVCVHAPAHVRALIADRVHAPRITDARAAVRLAVPATALTLLLGATLWPVFPGSPLPRLLSLTIQGLSALTLPHMLFEFWLHRRPTAFHTATVGSVSRGR